MMKQTPTTLNGVPWGAIFQHYRNARAAAQRGAIVAVAPIDGVASLDLELPLRGTPDATLSFADLRMAFAELRCLRVFGQTRSAYSAGGLRTCAGDDAQILPTLTSVVCDGVRLLGELGPMTFPDAVESLKINCVAPLGLDVSSPNLQRLVVARSELCILPTSWCRLECARPGGTSAEVALPPPPLQLLLGVNTIFQVDELSAARLGYANIALFGAASVRATTAGDAPFNGCSVVYSAFSDQTHEGPTRLTTLNFGRQYRDSQFRLDSTSAAFWRSPPDVQAAIANGNRFEVCGVMLDYEDAEQMATAALRLCDEHRASDFASRPLLNEYAHEIDFRTCENESGGSYVLKGGMQRRRRRRRSAGRRRLHRCVPPKGPATKSRGSRRCKCRRRP
jgi:hypothetical protein